MKNPWLDIPLDDYESHMTLPHVGQSQLLSQLLGEAIESYRPSSIALLGCAGGNGLERVPSTSVERVVGIDINQRYLERTADRYRDNIPHLELFAGDLGVDRFVFKVVHHQRLIDRDNDVYRETVTDYESGEIIYHCEEPLSEHQGHGSAKPKKGET